SGRRTPTRRSPAPRRSRRRAWSAWRRRVSTPPATPARATRCWRSRALPPPPRRSGRLDCWQPYADDLEAPGRGPVRVRVHLVRAVAQDLVVVAQLHAGRDEHAGRQRQQLDQAILDASRQRRVPRLLLQEPGPVGDMAVLVLGDELEALGEAGQHVVRLAETG